jgi:hypothetical protein
MWVIRLLQPTVLLLGLDGSSHRIGRVLSFFSSRRNWDSTNPQPQANVPHPFGSGGRAHSLAREGLGESQFQRGDIHCVTLYIYVLCSSFTFKFIMKLH